MSTAVSRSPSPGLPSNALIAVAPPPWRPIMHALNQVVLYNPHSHALTISTLQTETRQTYNELPYHSLCPYCHQPMPDTSEGERSETPTARRAPNYFHLLAMANETNSRPVTPNSSQRAFGGEALAEGYYESFFREERRLGMGANGTVFLCQHVLDDNTLGHFAVKKIAVGRSHAYLLKTLREVRLLETFRHPNIITYHHAWLESCQFSSFGERIPTLFVLMQWAEGGSLDSLLEARLGTISPSSSNSATPLSPSARKRSFRAAKLREDERGKTPVHLLGSDEIAKLFEDIVVGLNFLHERSILHLDLKPANVLLTWDEGASIPRAMLSDFGASQDIVTVNKERTGDTGTLEYMAPEMVTPPLLPPTKAADLWSLGMILHSLIFFRLPYTQTKNIEQLEVEIMTYPGYTITADVREACERRGLPVYTLKLLEWLLDRKTSIRPSTERIISAIKAGKLKSTVPSSEADVTSIVTRFSLHTHVAGDGHDDVRLMEETVEEDKIVDSDGDKQDDGVEASVQARRLISQSPVGARRRPSLWMSPPTRHLTMAIKTGTLITKIVTLPIVCPSIRLNSWRGALMVGLAATDLWTDSFAVSSALVGAHACLIALFSLT